MLKVGSLLMIFSYVTRPGWYLYIIQERKRVSRHIIRSKLDVIMMRQMGLRLIGMIIVTDYGLVSIICLFHHANIVMILMTFFLTSANQIAMEFYYAIILVNLLADF